MLTTQQIILITVAGLSGLLALIWLWLSSRHKATAKHHQKPIAKAKTTKDGANVAEVAEYDVEHIFNTEFREELRNRGRLYFEKIINENAMFLQQDLRLTTSELNDYMKKEIKTVLQDEFSKYEESISGAKDLAIASIEKTKAAIEEQRTLLQEQLLSQVAAEKQRVMKRFEDEMADVINHYVLMAIGNEIDLSDQLDYIIQYLEDNKQALIEDVNHGA